MYFEQFFLGCLAHASYMIGSKGEAAVVDPQRDVDIYLKAAQEHSVQIRHIFETHLHADFVSGHKELAARTGAQIYMGAAAGAIFPHVALHDGFQLNLGDVRIQVLATPGHTLESVCLLITDEENSPKPCAVLTGDTLFLGDVGRPDLSRQHTPAELAAMLYESLHGKLMSLSDEVLVYPAHGAGSLCGRSMRAERSSTIGTERLTNYALQIRSRDEFVRQLICNLPARPDYFLQDAEINRTGAPPLAEMRELAAISPADLKVLMREGAVALDARAGEQFAAGHVPGSVNIPLSGQFASWAGAIVGLSSKPVLIAASAEQVSEARMRLARVGIEDVQGYLQNGVEGWQNAGFPVQEVQQMSVRDLQGHLRSHSLAVLDVRREPEWQAGHIEGAAWWPLDHFKVSPPEIDRERPLAVHCKSGYRSIIACSLLQRAGYANVINVIGGFDAWQEAKLSSASEKAVEV